MRPFILLVLLVAGNCLAGELRFALHHEPKTLNPLLAADDASEALRYLTSGVLVRTNRLTQESEPELARSWKISPDNRSITFQLRENVQFSDRSQFTSVDVLATLAMLADPSLRSPVADSFLVAGTPPQAVAPNPYTVTVRFAAPVASLERLFDQLPILPARPATKERCSLGPFVIERYQPGVEVLLKRNPTYWRKDTAGRPLPYLEAVRLSIQANREIELNRFQRGELDLINNLDPESYERLAREMPGTGRDNGPSSAVEFLWFNMSPGSPLPAYKKAWFQSVEFRRAISLAINREDLSRVVYRGHARPAVGPFSPANRFWFNTALPPLRFDPAAAAKLLAAAGFREKNGTLSGPDGHAVEFSLITNAGNKVRERMAALIQQDLERLGIKLNLVTLDMTSLLDRLSNTSQYEACLLGLTNVDPDPNELMNVLLSSGRQHAWNPSQKVPATPWEAEIDSLMRAQSAAMDRGKRKQLFDRVQQILRREEPYIYLLNRNSLSAVAARVVGAHPVAMYPETFWNVERLSVK